MADNRELSSVIRIGDADYNVHAKTAESADSAKKVANKLTISVNQGSANVTKIAEFDGSEGKTATIDLSEYAKKGDLFSKNYNDLTNKPTIPTDTNQTIKADGKTFGASDIVEFIAGSNVTIIGDTENKKITISSTGGGGGGNSDYAEYAEYTNKIQVNMEHAAPYATITISSDEPSEGNVGDIWFKY